MYFDQNLTPAVTRDLKYFDQNLIMSDITPSIVRRIFLYNLKHQTGFQVQIGEFLKVQVYKLFLFLYAEVKTRAADNTHLKTN